MNRNIRNITAAITLSFMLAGTPLIAAPRQVDNVERNRPSIVKVLKRLVTRIFKLTPNDFGPTGPVPAPSNVSTNP